jgi:hypothetical protein
MRASRGMGDMNPSKMPKARKVRRKDNPDEVDVYAKGGKTGLYTNIHSKRKRIESGSGEKMRKPGAAGAPTAKAFRQSAKTAKR